MKKTLGIGLVCVFLFSACSAQPQPPTPTAATSAPAEKVRLIALSEIAAHAKPTDCWFAVDGSVYDVSPYIASGKHPGDAAILAGCGKDASALFHSKGSQGQDHSAQAQAYLQKFLIGTLQ